MLEKSEIREAIKYENDLIHQRLSWLGTFQGLLLAALVFGWKENGGALVYVISPLGFGIAFSIGVGTYRANKAINKFEAIWDKERAKKPAEIDVVGIRNRSPHLWWFMPGYFIPPAFATAWLAILIVRLFVQR